MLNEAKIIDNLKQNFMIPGGIGDDAAIFGDYVISKDLLVEDIHFRCKYVDPISLGYKALQVNLSDIAAMGAKGVYVLLGIAIPKDYAQYVEDFLKSFSDSCKAENIQLIGGDTTASEDKLYISITIIGITKNPILRNGAKVGDLICVFGDLGHAHIGLQAFEKSLDGFDEFKKAFLWPKAKNAENNISVTAMMDISDGLLVDLKKLCKASKVAAQIDLDSFKNTPAFYNACKELELDPLAVIINGGEDYGLLMTMSPDAVISPPLRVIGKIIEGNEGEVIFKKPINLTLREFSHFGEL